MEVCAHCGVRTQTASQGATTSQADGQLSDEQSAVGKNGQVFRGAAAVDPRPKAAVWWGGSRQARTQGCHRPTLPGCTASLP